MVGMESGVGASLREARKRRELDLADVEAAIKIRVRYLQAIEDEDWDVLPGDVYVRGFVRTYASYLGLDGERLVEEYRRGAEAERQEGGPRRVEPVGSAIPSSGRRRAPGGILAFAIALALVGLAIAVGLTGDDEDDGPAARGVAAKQERSTENARPPAAEAGPGVGLALTATDEVWVCLLDGEGRALIDGKILASGERAGPFRSDGFSAAFGNGAIELTVDGKAAPTAAASGPVGYEIDAAGELTPLEEGERPDCE
jgi:Helix-turn-helix domain